MSDVIALLLLSMPGWISVVIGATVAARIPFLRSYALPARLAASHTAIVVFLTACSPVYIAADPASDYGDIYPPFLYVPGFPVLWCSAVLGNFAAPLLLRVFAFYTASVIAIVVLPAVISIVIGGCIWFCIGLLWARIARWVT